MIRETRTLLAEGDTLELDPFAFWPDRSSRFMGMGGKELGDDPDYAFHTLYVACGTGPIAFTVAVAGLRSQRGTLIMRIHELPEVMGAHARQVAISQTQLIDLIRSDGRVSLPASARQGNHYALVGFVYGDTAAKLDELAIEIARRSPGTNDPTVPTRFRAGEARVGSAPQIVGKREGTLITPVSQLCTARQAAEPVMEAVLRQIGDMTDAPMVTRWEYAFLARTLDRYDVARSGARGLGFGAMRADGSVDPLANWTLSHGCHLTLTSPVEPTRNDDLPPRTDGIVVDPLAIEGIGGYDFAWATRAGGVGGKDRQLVLHFLEDALRALKPGGLLAVVVPLDATPREPDDTTGILINRHDIDRIAMVLLSRGHQVAQLAPWGQAVIVPDTASSSEQTAFGLIIRRAA